LKMTQNLMKISKWCKSDANSNKMKQTTETNSFASFSQKLQTIFSISATENKKKDPT
jgi:hypothetical protein